MTLKQRILSEIIPTYLRDNRKARLLLPDGSHERLQPAAGEPSHRCQEELLTIRPAIAPLDQATPGNGAPRHGPRVIAN